MDCAFIAPSIPAPAIPEETNMQLAVKRPRSVIRIISGIGTRLLGASEPMPRRTRMAFESLALLAVACGLVQFALQFADELAIYGFGWTVYGTIAATIVALASICLIARKGFRPAAYLWLAILCAALLVTGYDIATGTLPQLKYSFGMLSVGFDAAAALILITWLRAAR